MAEDIKTDVINTKIDGDGSQSKDMPDKTFTQAELDTIIEDRIARVKKGIPSKEELTAFKTWQDQQKTEAEKNAEKLKEVESLRAELKARDFQDKARDAKVNSKFIKFVVSEVKAELKDNEDFDEKLKLYLEANPEFITAASETKPTGLRQGASIKTKSDEQTYLEQKYRNNPYFKK